MKKSYLLPADLVDDVVEIMHYTPMRSATPLHWRGCVTFKKYVPVRKRRHIRDAYRHPQKTSKPMPRNKRVSVTLGDQLHGALVRTAESEGLPLAKNMVISHVRKAEPTKLAATRPRPDGWVVGRQGQ